jgi:hypothetical protein
MNKNVGTKMLDPIKETLLLVVACVYLFPILWTIPNLFMEIWVLFLKIHNFRRLELSPFYPNVSTHFISWLDN